MEIPVTPWAEFYPRFRRRWEQGEHVFVNGQTGSGKTDLALRILNIRDYSVFFVTKPKDPIFRSELARGYRRAYEWNPKSTDRRIMLSAKNQASGNAAVAAQQQVFGHALESIYHQGGWAVGVDESLWIANRLKLANEIGAGAHMGRALGLSYVFATQRPAHIPVIIPQSASHAFIGKTGRKSDLATLAELGGDVRATAAAIQGLRGQHDFLYVDTQGKLPLQVVNTHA